MPNSVTICFAMRVQRCMSVPGPRRGLVNTISSAQRPPRSIASSSITRSALTRKRSFGGKRHVYPSARPRDTSILVDRVGVGQGMDTRAWPAS